MYDYLVVGAGLFGATFSRLMTDAGKTCLVIDKRNHIGGNVYTEDRDGIHIHKYGPHIFHTSNDEIWEFVNKYATFNNYIHRVKASYKGKFYTLPFNLKTFNEVANIKSIKQLKGMTEQWNQDPNKESNLEAWAISQVGKEVYQTLIKGYTEKQWDCDPKELPASIIKRLPIRYTFEDNYFNDTYQGIPEEGYTKLIRNMLDGIPYLTDMPFSHELKNIAYNVVYSGPIDEYFNYELGKLEYRSLDFANELYEDIDYFQGCSQINYTEKFIPYTRIIEHKHFYPNLKTDHTIITREFPTKYGEPYYPINDDKNNKLYNEYRKMAKEREPDVIFGGRLGNYKYYDMHQVIGQAMKCAKLEKEKQANN
jgi:UDP-galactopyranose mutase